MHKDIQARSDPPAIVVMGVAGCGKSAVGMALARRLSSPYVEGDALHPAENIARMKSGQPLTDAHREGWLDAVGQSIAFNRGEGHGVVAACSALKRSYRERLRAISPGIIFLYLEINLAEAHRRVALRKNHFMPASLVDSQFEILEPPAPDEAAITLGAALPVEELAALAAKRLEADVDQVAGE